MIPTLLAPAFIFLAALFGLTVPSDDLPYQYFAPLPGAQLVSAQTTIGIRPGPELDASAIGADLFVVTGTLSGEHAGKALLARDQCTVIFQPAQPFLPGETVDVTIQPGLTTLAGDPVPGLSYAFTVSPKEGAPLPTTPSELEPSGNLVPAAAYRTPQATDPAAADADRRYYTLPSDFPVITTTVHLEAASDDPIFLGLLRYPSAALILDANVEPIYFHTRPTGVMDFKRQPDGHLSYFDGHTQEFRLLDNSYTIVDTIRAGNGYAADPHELLIRENGNALLMIYDAQPVDMSQIVPLGQPNATVVGLVIQELDVDDNVIFEWRSWDYIPVTDSWVDLNVNEIDYMHGNSIDIDNDGHLLISSRHLDEVTKINGQTGAVIWRLSGKANQFTFSGGNVGGFRWQHDARRLPNGNLTVFDNYATDAEGRNFSRAAEYKLDEVNMTAELVWSYRDPDDTFGRWMGNAQRRPNGNTVIGWGSASPTLTEVTPDNEKVFELVLPPGLLSYRVFRFPWQGFPADPPTLVARAEGDELALYYSWNGATEIAAYRLYAVTQEATTLIGEQAKTGFETKTLIDAETARQYCVWQVMPVDRDGNETQLSNLAFSDTGDCSRTFLPLVAE